MNRSYVFKVFLGVLGIELIAGGWFATQYPFLLRVLTMPALMLLLSVGLVSGFLQRSGMAWPDTGVTALRGRALAGSLVLGVLAAGVWLLLIKYYAAALERVFPGIEKLAFTDSFWNGILAYGGAGMAAKRLMLAYVLLALAAAEEIIFRGYIQNYLARHTSQFWAITWASLLFSVVHLSPLAVLMTLPLSVMLGLLMRYTGNITAPLVAHFVFNMALITVYGKAG